jgi:hypothetical protein
MRLVPFRTPIFASAAILSLLTGGAASAAGTGFGGGFHAGGGLRAGPAIVAPRQGASALPARGQWVGNDGFGGPGYHWRPGHRWGHGYRHAGARRLGPLHRHFGYDPYLQGYGVGYLGGGSYEVGYYGGNGVFYVENFYGYTDDLYRPAAYTAASGYAPLVGDPVYFDLTAGRSMTPPVYRPPVISEPTRPLPHIIDLSTATDSPNIVK